MWLRNYVQYFIDISYVDRKIGDICQEIYPSYISEKYKFLCKFSWLDMNIFTTDNIYI